MDKQKIVNQLIAKLEVELSAAEEATETARSYRDSDDLKSEGKYDTRAVEASYLAGAQLKRVEELKLDRQMLLELADNLNDTVNGIAIGSLVELEINSKKQWYFLSSTGGGSLVSIEGRAILVVSVFSPLGNQMLGANVNEVFEVETPKGLKEYLICSVK
jgi:transcription elongation GreA/GreB family factor